MNYIGVIIEESLDPKFAKEILGLVKIISTKVEQVVEKHKTPWLKQWTLHTVEVKENDAENVAKRISYALDLEHEWYADFKNDKVDFIIFRNKIFKIDKNTIELYKEAREYGISLGIPEYQVAFDKRLSINVKNKK